MGFWKTLFGIKDDIPPPINDIPKEQATKEGKPYFEIVDFTYTEEDPSAGNFELDWNDIFVQGLRRAGYQGQEDHNVVDNYFTNVCRHVVMETFEKDEAMRPEEEKKIKSRDLGDGRTEYS